MTQWTKEDLLTSLGKFKRAAASIKYTKELEELNEWNLN